MLTAHVALRSAVMWYLPISSEGREVLPHVVHGPPREPVRSTFLPQDLA